MQTQIDAIKRRKTIPPNEKQEQKRARKKILPRICDERLIHLCKTAEEKFNEFIKIGRTLKIFGEVKSVDDLDNNKIARESLKKIEIDIFPNTIVRGTNSVESLSVMLENGCQIDELVFNYSYSNQTETTIKFTNLATNSSYFVPKCSRFIIGEVKFGVDLLLKECTKFDLIIIDPPWENKSVKRKRNYEMLPENELCQLEIGKILNENGLLALWVTNNQRLQTFARKTLAEKWNVKIVAEWIWLKSTTRGEPVCEFRPYFKMPFEILLIGTTKENILAEKIPCQKFFMSVPCVLPSRKVPLMDILIEYLPEKYSTLELFARNLLPDATSIGLEVLKMQNENCFKIF